MVITKFFYTVEYAAKLINVAITVVGGFSRYRIVTHFCLVAGNTAAIGARYRTAVAAAVFAEIAAFLAAAFGIRAVRQGYYFSAEHATV